MRKKSAPVVIDASAQDVADSIHALHYEMERNAIEQLAQAAKGNELLCAMLATAVTTAAEQVLRVEGLGEEDERLAREQYTFVLGKAREALGDDAAQYIAEACRQHNEHARKQLDETKGRTCVWVLPKFNDDGTHDPVPPGDAPTRTA